MIYLTTPYSHDEWSVRNRRFDAVCLVAAKLIIKGMLVFSPISHSHPIALAGNICLCWETWREFDEWFIQRCDALAVVALPGWRDSHGVAAEIELANKFGKPILFFDEHGTEMPRGEVS